MGCNMSYESPRWLHDSRTTSVGLDGLGLGLLGRLRSRVRRSLALAGEQHLHLFQKVVVRIVETQLDALGT